MATVVKLSGKGEADKDPRRPSPPAGGLAAIRVTPLQAAGIIGALVVLVAGLWFTFGRGTSAASTPMMDTSSETSFGVSPDSQRANGMDTGTGSGNPASTNNGMDTGTGQ